MKYAVALIVLLAAGIAAHAWYFSGAEFAWKLVVEHLLGIVDGGCLCMWALDSNTTVRLPW